ncbi:MAG TPA: NUDIX domain-containing protein [Bacteriovoracaceae bacterium]|nr:NUDIX domain-containing protein [Bacteriovoracaceae bacterium]
MDKKTRKAQVVLAVNDQSSHSFDFLLLQTNKRRGEFWQNVTGKIEEGETYDEGGLREAIEETGLKVESIIDIVDLGITHDFVDERKRTVHEKSFLIVLDGKWDVKIDPHEHGNFKWVHLKDLNKNSVKHIGNYEALEKSIQLLKHWGI